MMKSDITTEPRWFDETGNYPFLKKSYHGRILNRIDSLIDSYSAKHSKTIAFRFDIRYPEDYPNYVEDSAVFERFIASFMKNLDRQGYDPKYLSAIEKADNSKHLHLHLLILLNNHLIQDIAYPARIAQSLWARALNITSAEGLIHYRTEGIEIRRNRPDYESNINRLKHYCQYMGKIDGKQALPRGMRSFNSSKNIKPKIGE